MGIKKGFIFIMSLIGSVFIINCIYGNVTKAIDLYMLINKSELLNENKTKEIFNVKIGENMKRCPDSFYIKNNKIFIIDGENNILVFENNKLLSSIALPERFEFKYKEFFLEGTRTYVACFSGLKYEGPEEVVEYSSNKNIIVDTGIDEKIKKNVKKKLNYQLLQSDIKLSFDYNDSKNVVLCIDDKGKKRIVGTFDCSLLLEKGYILYNQEIIGYDDSRILCMFTILNPGDALWEQKKMMNLLVVLNKNGTLLKNFWVKNGSECYDNNDFFVDEDFIIYQMFEKDNSIMISQYGWR
ncbi:MAG: hypothetical protein JXR90_04150 [Spirochaetes bacterium]|nr:hypothetical protein [Spirochaetota bacterium]